MNFSALQLCIQRIPLEHRWVQADGNTNTQQLFTDLMQILVDCQVDIATAQTVASNIVDDVAYVVADLQGKDLFGTGFETTPYLLNAEIERFVRRHVTTRLCRLLQACYASPSSYP
jgi:hypothetical protein